MRVEAGARAPGAERLEAGAGQFGAALARAGRRDDRAAEAGRRAGCAGQTRSRPAPWLRAPASPAEPGERAAGPGEPPRPSLTEREARSQATGADLEPVPQLAAAVRVLPAAVAAASAAGGAPLALSFGRSLEVELRAGATGVEVVLRPEPALAHAARAELPRIVAALRRQGVAVGRAEVRPRGSAGRRAR